MPRTRTRRWDFYPLCRAYKTFLCLVCRRIVTAGEYYRGRNAARRVCLDCVATDPVQPEERVAPC